MLISASLMLDSADWLLPGFLERSWPLLGFSLGLLWGSFGDPFGDPCSILGWTLKDYWRLYHSWKTPEVVLAILAGFFSGHPT